MKLVQFFSAIFLLFSSYIATYFLTHSENYFTFYPLIDTNLASGFSQAKFDTIQPGMDKNEVLKILGEPLGNYKLSSDWSYSSDGKCGWLCDLAWISYKLHFNDEGKVIHKEQRIYND
jgi:hypothetical protein